MFQSDKLSRRDFLRLSGLGVATLFAGPILNSCAFTKQAADLEISLQAVPGEVPILPGKATRVWSYQGQVTKGDPASLQTLTGSYLGPILRVRKGQRVRITFTNNLPEQSIVHWHGLHVPDDMDGHPRFAIGPNKTYVYEFQVLNRAGTYWFHPHPDKLTGPQVYQGMTGLFLVSDNEEMAASLPSGKFDIPLIIQDRTFDADNQLSYLPVGTNDVIMGFLGDHILVNGQPDFVLPVATRPYRLRLLNGSNSRVYKLGWQDGTPLTVIATDGGLLEKPVQHSYVTLAPAERVELWVDFSGRSVGSELRLQSLTFNGVACAGVGMFGGCPLPKVPVGSELTVLRVLVERKSEEKLSLPERLSTFPHYRLEDAVNREKPRTFTLGIQEQPPFWIINGRAFEMGSVAADETVKLNTLEVWEFINQPGTMSMGTMKMTSETAHPIHIHGLQFQVIGREVRQDKTADWGTVSAGFVDEGWKDTVLVMPGERVKLLLKFENYAGLYLYHCHNLEHEDLGMMRNYRITA